MNDDFSDSYRLPAYMDDFIYPQGTVASLGSKLAVAKSVLREVLSKSSNVNWAFSYYRNPDRSSARTTRASAIWAARRPQPPTGFPIGGATTAGQALQNGGLEWLYLADCDSDQGTPWRLQRPRQRHLHGGRVSRRPEWPLPAARPQGHGELRRRLASSLSRRRPRHVARIFRTVRRLQSLRRLLGGRKRHGHLPQFREVPARNCGCTSSRATTRINSSGRADR